MPTSAFSRVSHLFLHFLNSAPHSPFSDISSSLCPNCSRSECLFGDAGISVPSSTTPFKIFYSDDASIPGLGSRPMCFKSLKLSSVKPTKIIQDSAHIKTQDVSRYQAQRPVGHRSRPPANAISSFKPRTNPRSRVEISTLSKYFFASRSQCASIRNYTGYRAIISEHLDALQPPKLNRWGIISASNLKRKLPKNAARL